MPLIRIRDVNTGFSSTYYSGEYDKRYLVDNGDIVIGMDGDFTAVRWSHGTALLNQRVCLLHSFTDKMLPGFMLYRVQDELDRIHRATQGSTVKHLSSRDLERSRIPVPPLDEQCRVVEILDTFSALVNDLSIGLPAELAARRKQYEYYRDRLLTFEEAA
jgi:type I restriction enzyme S subunit